MSADERFMRVAIELAGRGLYTADPNPRVGSVLVRDGRIIGQGYHRRVGGPHAEIEALHDCQRRGENPRGATAYITLEPCSFYGRTPPCCDALINARVSRVVIGGRDPHPKVAGSSVERLRAAGIEVVENLLRDECEALNPGFLSRMRRNRPWVRAKLAASLDGRTALASGYSQWITSEQARQDVQHLRARAGAVLTGSGTVLHDNPQLNVRLTQDNYGPEWPIRQPLLAVIDGQLSTPSDARLLQRDAPVLLYTAGDTGRLLPPAEIVSLPATDGCRVDLAAVLTDLAAREVNEVHVEAGPALCGALLQCQLIDELVVYIAPVLLGHDARELVSIGGIDNMLDRPEFAFSDVRTIGPDLRLTLTPQYATPA